MRSAWRLLLDQNMRYESKEILTSRGIDVLHASDVGLQRALDPEVLQYAIEQDRVLVTHDSEFGDLNIFPLPRIIMVSSGLECFLQFLYP